MNKGMDIAALLEKPQVRVSSSTKRAVDRGTMSERSAKAPRGMEEVLMKMDEMLSMMEQMMSMMQSTQGMEE